MSTENAIKFLNQVEEVPTLKERLQAITTPSELIELAQEQGYEVSAEDFKSLQAVVDSDSNEELSEDELEAVAGGGLFDFIGDVVKDTVGYGISIQRARYNYGKKLVKTTWGLVKDVLF